MLEIKVDSEAVGRIEAYTKRGSTKRDLSPREKAFESETVRLFTGVVDDLINKRLVMLTTWVKPCGNNEHLTVAKFNPDQPSEPTDFGFERTQELLKLIYDEQEESNKQRSPVQKALAQLNNNRAERALLFKSAE